VRSPYRQSASPEDPIGYFVLVRCTLLQPKTWYAVGPYKWLWTARLVRRLCVWLEGSAWVTVEPWAAWERIRACPNEFIWTSYEERVSSDHLR
jgi:hypothetical protein